MGVPLKDPSPCQLLRKRYTLEGSLDRHHFDVVVGNGIPYFAAQALSFELPDLTTLKKTMDATAWTVADVLEQTPNLPVGMLALPPVTGADWYPRALEFFERGKKIFDGLGAKVLTENELEPWADQGADRIQRNEKIA